MFAISGYFRSAFLWAMIPLTVFAGRPTTGCTCASGEYKFYCAAHLFSGNAHPEMATECGKSCCRQNQHNSLASPCCQNGGCTHSNGRGTPGGKNCCKPDTLTASAVASGVSISIDADHQLLFDLPVVELGTALPDTTVACFISQDTGPPGGDLVISLRRLLI